MSKIIAKKLTDVSLLREMGAITTGKECKMSLATAYKNQHSLIRTQMWVIKFYDIPTSVMSHLVRHVHAQPFVKTSRPDRGAESFEQVCETLADELSFAYSQQDTETYARKAIAVRKLSERFDRNKPVDMALLLNSEEIINISKARLCYKASKETREWWQAALDVIEETDPDLVKHCQKTCVLTGVCKESSPCGFMNTPLYGKQREAYFALFSRK